MKHDSTDDTDAKITDAEPTAAAEIPTGAPDDAPETETERPTSDEPTEEIPNSEGAGAMLSTASLAVESEQAVEVETAADTAHDREVTESPDIIDASDFAEVVETADPPQPNTPDGAISHYRQIRGVVLSVKALIASRLRWDGVIHAFALTAALLLIGTILFAFVPAHAWLRVPFVLLWLVGTGALVWQRTLRPLRMFSGSVQVAAWIEAQLPSFRNDITASLQFGADLDGIRRENQMSIALIERLLAKTHRKVTDETADIIATAPKPRLNIPYGTLASVVVVFMALAVFAPDTLRSGLSGLAFGPPAAISATTEQVVERSAIVADIALSYNFPAYSGLAPRRVSGSTGDIEALRGTEVQFEATSLRPVSRAELVLSTEADAAADETTTDTRQRIRLERRTGNRLVANFSVMSSGSYTIEATLADGTEVEDGITRTLSAVPDENPNITVSQPEAEVDVSPEDVVTFRYEASDDYGLTELAIVTSLNGAEDDRQRTLLKTLEAGAKAVPGDSRPTSPTGQPRAAQGEHQLDLIPFKLKPKDQLIVRLEVVDNDTVNGPKVTASEPIVLRVSSPEDKHLQIIADQEELVEAMITNLADFLENSIQGTWIDAIGNRRTGINPEWDTDELTRRYKAAIPPHADAGDIITTMTSLLDRMEQDPLMRKRDFDLFKMTRDDLQERFVTEEEQITVFIPIARENRLRTAHLERLWSKRRLSIRSTEQGILRLDDLIASQRMENVLDSAKSLQEIKERLKELMEKYKETQDEAIKAEIMREMQRLRQQMMEMMAKMRQQIKELPQEHMNMEALEKNEMMEKVGDIGDNFDKIQEMLEKGDIDGAMKALEEMGENIDSMVEGMEQDFDGMQPEGLSELDKKVSEIMDEVNDLKAQEDQLAKETDAIAEEMEKEQKEMLEKAIEEFADKQLEKLEKLKQKLDDVNAPNLSPSDMDALKKAQADAEDLKEALEQRDIAQAFDEANKLSKELRKADANMKLRSGYMPRNDPRRASYQSAQDGVSKAAPRSEEIAEDLRKMMEKGQNGQASPEQRGKLQKLGQQQGEVRDRLGQLQKKIQEMGGEFPMLQEQLGPGMKEAGQYMEGAKQRLGQGQARKAHGNEQMAMGKLEEMKQTLKQTLKQQKMGRGKQTSQEPVTIPDADRSAPREFREDLMDAMKENSLENYKSELQLYYESLVR